MAYNYVPIKAALYLHHVNLNYFTCILTSCHPGHCHSSMGFGSLSLFSNKRCLTLWRHLLLIVAFNFLIYFANYYWQIGKPLFTPVGEVDAGQNMIRWIGDLCCKFFFFKKKKQFILDFTITFCKFSFSEHYICWSNSKNTAFVWFQKRSVKIFF